MSHVATAVSCLVCATDIDLPDGTEAGDIVCCPGCATDHEVVEVTPAIRLDLAPEIEEDWGE